LKHYTISYIDDDYIFCERCKCKEISDEAIKNEIINITTLEINNYIFRCTNETDLEWLYKMGISNKKELDRNSLIREVKHTLEEIKDHITHIFYCLKISLKSYWLNDLI